MDNQTEQYFGNVIAPSTLSNSTANLPSQSTMTNIGNLLGRTQNVVKQINGTNTPTPQPQAKKTGLFDRLLPTIGSVLGGLGAGAADIVTGGAAIPFDAAIAGLGGAAGKTAENALTGQNLWKGDLESGAEGAIGQGTGMLAGKALGAAGDAISNMGARGLASASAGDQASQALAENERIGNEFGAVNPKVAQVGPAIAKAQELGIANPTAQDLKNLGNMYTGTNAETGDGVLNFVKNQALEKAGGSVDFSNVMDNLHGTLAQPDNELQLGVDGSAPGSNLTAGSKNNIATSIVRQVRNLMPETLDSSGQIAEQTSPEDAQTVLKAVGNKLNSFNSLDPANPNYQAQLAEQNVWKSIYGDMRQAVYDRPEVDAAVAKTTVNPDLEAAIDDAIKSNGVTDPQVTANIKADMINTINNSQTAPDLLKAESPMVNVSKVGNIQTDSDINNPQLSKSVKSNASQIKNQNGLLGKDPLKTGLDVGGAYEALVKGHPAALLPALAYNVAKSPGAQSAIGNILSRAGSTGGMLGAGALAQIPANSPNDVAGAANGSNQISLNQGANVNPLANSPLSTVLNQDISAGNAALADPFTAGNYSSQISQLSTILPIIQKVAEAEQAVQGLQQSFNQSGGAQGPLGGTLSKLGSLFTGGPAANYGKQVQQAESALTGAGINAPNVPSITQNQPAAQQSLSNIQGLINSLLLGGQNASTSAIPGVGQ